MSDPQGKSQAHALELTDSASMEFKRRFSDKLWRMNNLYYIIDDAGQRILFHLNVAQMYLLKNLHTQNLILKARQLGFTTFIDIYFLDECLFNSDVEAGIIAHNRDDAGKIFRRKILYPYENLPDWLLEVRPTKSKSKSELELSNNSIITVGTSFRSGTAQLLHISEFGKVCARFPEKAREIVTGALEAIHTESGQCLLFIESTAEGKAGYFYDYCKEAQDAEAMNKELSSLDFKFHFFPWYQNPNNTVPQAVPITRDFLKYFAELEETHGVELDQGQKYWYVRKHNRLGDDMKREHPSTPAEAFDQSIKGAYFQNQFQKIRKDDRICSVPVDSGIGVKTWWDLGMNDVMAIWFTQDVGREIHVIDYLEGSGEGFEYYYDRLQDLGYRYTEHNAPHDISVRELGTGVSRWEAAKKVGINFERIPRVNDKMDSINAARRFLGICWFDEVRCSDGLVRLENYRKKWNEHAQCYDNKPLHDENSNGADAFQTLAMGHNFRVSSGAVITIQQQSARGWT